MIVVPPVPTPVPIVPVIDSGYSVLLSMLLDMIKVMVSDPGFYLLGFLLAWTFLVMPPIIATMFFYEVYNNYTNGKIYNLANEYMLKVNDDSDIWKQE